MIVYNDPAATAAICGRAKVKFVRGFDQCAARLSPPGELLGGVVFTNYNRASIQMHTASFRSRWMNRELLRVAFSYPFHGLNVKKVVLTINENNHPSLAFALHLGFNPIARITDIFVDGDMLILSMYKSQCRFLSI